MKKIITLLASVMMTITVSAMPAQRGIWKTINLENGSTVTAQLVGDEFFSYYLAADGTYYVYNPQTKAYSASVTVPVPAQKKNARRPMRVRRAAAGSPQQKYATNEFIGEKKGLVILVEFPNQAFQKGNDRALYNRILNEPGFSEGKFKGSVRDYFLAQSDNRFSLDFDVVGPVMMDSVYNYYGQRGTETDMHPQDMVIEACTKVADQVNFKDYDWDGDGYVDQVFILYAGQGESNGGGTDTIWPHEYTLTGWTGHGLELDGVTIDTYACSNEVDYKWEIEGIGTICHEFSHCMGLADLYDTFYSGNFGVGHFDLLSHAGWNDGGFRPAGYTSYEKMVCGWLTPTVLSTEDVEVSHLKALSEGGGAYIIYNEGNKNEYFMLENRQKTGWDTAIPDSGLLVLHVDYDEDLWINNYVNTYVDNRNVPGTDQCYNNHERLTIMHADNDDDRKYWLKGSTRYSKQTEDTDCFPFEGNDSITNNSLPAFKVYNNNTDGHRYLNHGVHAITRNADGTVSFRFKAINKRYIDVDPSYLHNVDTTGAVFYESFNECYGTGGNDGVFKGDSKVASAEFFADNSGWEYSAAGGAALCAKFGSGFKVGEVSSPVFQLPGDTLELSFYAAPWGSDDEELIVTAEGNAQMADTLFTMKTAQWTYFTTLISGTGATRLHFVPGKRFFLDEVLVRRLPSASGIHELSSRSTAPNAYYSLDGRRLTAPQPGIVIVRYSDGTTRKLLLK